MDEKEYIELNDEQQIYLLKLQKAIDRKYSELYNVEFNDTDDTLFNLNKARLYLKMILVSDKYRNPDKIKDIISNYNYLIER